MNKIAIILPAYNEEFTIRETIEAFYKESPKARFIVVDNNSFDNTSKIAKSTLKKNNIDGLVIHERAQGKGNALRAAFMRVDADIYVIADADMTYPASSIHELILPIKNDEADMVVGDRHSNGKYKIENKRKFHGFGNFLVNTIINILFGSKLKDSMSGYRAFSYHFIKNYPILVSGFQVEVDMTLHALDKRFRIREIPIDYKDRPTGSNSKLNTISDGTKVIFALAQILRYYKPLIFFNSISMTFPFSGFLAGYPVLIDWINYKYIYHIPLAILACSLEIAALIFFAIGLMLDSISHQNKMNYEHTILRTYRK